MKEKPYKKFVAHMDRIVAVRDKPRVTAGNILLPDNAVQDNIYCTVVAVGPKVEGFAVGDKVLIPHQVNREQWFEDERKYVFTSPEHILAKVDGEAKS